MKIIGITGGIGSGKTTVSNLLRKSGYIVFDCDLEARNIYDTDIEVISKMKEMFGDNIYKDGVLDRKLIAKIVFSDKSSLDKLNALIHPKTREIMFKRISETANELFFVESAILFEFKLNECMDKVICITAPDDIRIKRVMKRDNITKEQVIARMKHQMNNDNRLKKSDYIINTDQDILSVKNDVFKIINELK